MSTPIGIIGLGNAGASVCKALLDKGQTVIGFDLSADRRKTAGGIGVTLGALQQAGAHFRAGRYLAAAEIYRDVIRKRPKLPDLHNNLGIALKAAGHVSDAIPCFRRAIRLKPDYVAAHANLASALEVQGRPVDAIEPNSLQLLGEQDLLDSSLRLFALGLHQLRKIELDRSATTGHGLADLLPHPLAIFLNDLRHPSLLLFGQL